MKKKYKVLIAAGFILLYGMEVVMFILLMKPDGIRIHAPVAGISVPLSTTVAGDAWMKGGARSIVVSARNAATGEVLTFPTVRDTINYHGQAVSALAAWHVPLTFPEQGRWLLSATVTAASDGRRLQTAERPVTASATAAARQFVFLSLPHILALLVILAWSVLVPVLVRRKLPTRSTGSRQMLSPLATASSSTCARLP